MSTGSKIEWTDTTWSPTTGCDRVSPGCDHCYALTLAKRLKAMGSAKYQRDGDPRTSGPGFGITEHPDTLGEPFRWRKPRRVFVNSMSDLFHSGVSDDFIARVWAVMAATPQHTYQVLSKRHARMRSLLSSQGFQHQVARAIDALLVDQDHDPLETWRSIPGFLGYDASSHGRIRSKNGILATQLNPGTGRPTIRLWNHGEPKTTTVHRLVLAAFEAQPDATAEVCHRNGDKTDNRVANLRWGTESDNQRERFRHGSRSGPGKLTLEDVQAIRAMRRGRRHGPTQEVVAEQFGISRSLVSMIENGKVWAPPELVWPLSNVHLGVSVEDQKRADLRIPALLATPATVRFLSCEPLLGPVDLSRWLDTPPVCGCGIAPDGAPGWSGGCSLGCMEPEPSGLHWCICGGESGPGARPMELDWARSLVAQCQSTGVPVFVKQDSGPRSGMQGRIPDDLWLKEFPDGHA